MKRLKKHSGLKACNRPAEPLKDIVSVERFPHPGMKKNLCMNVLYQQGGDDDGSTGRRKEQQSQCRLTKLQLSPEMFLSKHYFESQTGHCTFIIAWGLLHILIYISIW